MDQSDLVLSIVCDIATPSIPYTKEEIGTLMLVSKTCVNCQLTKDSVDVLKAQYFLEELNSNAISLAFAKNKEDTEKIVQLKTKKTEILDTIFNEEGQLLDYFTMGLMATYKEMIYDSKHDCFFRDIEYAIMFEYDCIIDKYFGGEQAVYDHIHKPMHPMFQYTDMYYYSFYYS